MANPRKFSEKIALHNQKQAEETAAFEQIMREVIGATRGAYQKHLHIHQTLGSYRAGSLPNVNQIGNNSIDLQSALTSLEDMKQGREGLERVHRERGRHATPHQSRRFPFEKRVDVSPYGSSSFLSPPPDTNWRRTNSDSALHQSAMNPQDNFHGTNTPPAHRRVHEVDGSLMVDSDQVKNYWDPKKQQFIPIPQSRPKSCEVPGINIYPSQEEANVVHVPISSNTGSLPDLTNLHFPSPLATPLDVEDQTGVSSATFNQQQQQQSPPHSGSSTLSPPSLAPQQHHTHVLGPSVSGGTLIQPTAGGGGGGGGGGGSRHSSPGPSPSPSSRRRHHHLTNLVIRSGSPRHHGHQHHTTQQQVRFTPIRHEPPRITVEGLTVDTNALSLDNYPTSQPQFGVYPHQPPQQQNAHQSFVYEPTTPTSPTMPQIPMGSYRSTSPADHSCSAPTSPVSHNLSPASSPGLGPTVSLSKSPFTDTNYYLQQQQQTSAIQHQLEQFKMMTENNAACTSSNSIVSHNNTAMFLATMDSGGGCGPPDDLGMGRGTGLHYTDPLPLGMSAQEVDNTAMYYSIPPSDPQIQSPTLYSKSMVISSSHQTTPQTPQTPTSIPDIILTAPGADEPIMRQDFAKDLGSAMASMSGGSFDSDLFPPDEDLRAGLDPIDFDGLQILTDPDMPVISDPATEETFRLDRS